MLLLKIKLFSNASYAAKLHTGRMLRNLTFVVQFACFRIRPKEGFVFSSNYWATFVTKSNFWLFFEQLFEKLRGTFWKISNKLWKALVPIHWIASTLCKVCVHLWSQNAGKGILEAHMLKFFPGEHAPGPPRGSRLRRSLERLAASKTALFLVGRVGISVSGLPWDIIMGQKQKEKQMLLKQVVFIRLINYAVTYLHAHCGERLKRVSGLCKIWLLLRRVTRLLDCVTRLLDCVTRLCCVTRPCCVTRRVSRWSCRWWV